MQDGVENIVQNSLFGAALLKLRCASKTAILPSSTLSSLSDRLADYKVASKERFSMSDFKQDPALQERVVRWRIADIDEAIDALGDKASEYSRDG